MVGKVTFTLSGAKEMEALLKDLGPKVASRIGDRALRAAAKPIVIEAKRLVPQRTGRLRRSITAIVSSKGRRANERLVLIGFRPPTSRRAHFIEFGTSHNAAHPFIRPAMDAKASEALTNMAEVLSQGLAREEWKNTLGLLADGTEFNFGD